VEKPDLRHKKQIHAFHLHASMGHGILRLLTTHSSILKWSIKCMPLSYHLFFYILEWYNIVITNMGRRLVCLRFCTQEPLWTPCSRQSHPDSGKKTTHYALDNFTIHSDHCKL